MTFADFAVTETRFRKHFRKVPRDAWHDKMVPLAEYIELRRRCARASFPYVWALDAKQQLSRLLVDETMVASTEERRDFWIMLQGHGRGSRRWDAATGEDLESRIRQEVVQKITVRTDGSGRWRRWGLSAALARVHRAEPARRRGPAAAPQATRGSQPAATTWRRGSIRRSARPATSASISTRRSLPTTRITRRLSRIRMVARTRIW